MSKILIVAAHPDDEILGCGGTMLKRINAGDEVFSMVLGEGITSRYDKREQADVNLLKSLDASHDAVAKFMGFKESRHFDLPDNRFDAVDLLDVIKIIEKTKNEIKPEIIFTHFENDLNIDHRITFQAVMTACRPIKGEIVKEIYSFETLSSTEWVSPYSGNNAFRPNVFVNIESTIEKKIKGMELYDSEIKPFPHPRSSEAIRIVSQRWGTVCGCANAEGFILIRKLL